MRRWSHGGLAGLEAAPVRLFIFRQNPAAVCSTCGENGAGHHACQPRHEQCDSVIYDAL